MNYLTLVPLSALVIAIAFCRCILAAEVSHTVPQGLMSVKATLIILAVAMGVVKLLRMNLPVPAILMAEVVWLAGASALAWDQTLQTFNYWTLGWLLLAQIVDVPLDQILDQLVATCKALWKA